MKNRSKSSGQVWTRREFIRGAGTLGFGVMAGTRNVANVFARGAAAAPLRGAIRIDLERRLGDIDPNLYGNFAEHLGRCIYGGIYEEGSPLADEDGFRKDVLEAARRLRVTQLRWPGGNFVSGYHWQDGIGPKGSRPTRYDLAWFERESNRFGTDEFIAYCRKLGAEPYVCVNMGTGTMDEASRWVEYCNRDGGTAISDLRKKNGHPEPYGVKLWGLGNEMYGEWQIGHKNAADYAKAALEFAKVMKWQDPSIKLVACGSANADWDRLVLETLVQHVDYISEHHYTITDDLNDYYEILGSVAQMESTIRNSGFVAESVSAAAKKSPAVGVAFDEWNILNSWSEGTKRDDVHKFEYHYNLRDALWVASALNALQRNCRTVRLANLAQLVNVIAPMHTSPTALLLDATYFPLELFANHSGNIALEPLVTSPRFQTRQFADQPYLDVGSTYDDESRRLRIAVVNRRKEGDVVATIDLTGFRAKPGGRAYLIAGASPEVVNTFSDPHAVGTRESKLEMADSHFDYTFPRHSVTLLEFEVNV